jgi:hypothetical protein
MILDGLPPGTTITVDATHTKFGLTGSGPGGNLGGEFENFTSVAIMEMQGTGALAGFNRFVFMNLQCQSHIGPRTLGDPVQTFPNDMFMMQGQLPPGDPDFDLLRITAGTNFGLPSPGQTTLTLTPGGDWEVDSFFDITYRIDFVGAPGGPLGGLSGSTTATIRMQMGEPSGVGGACCTSPIDCFLTPSESSCPGVWHGPGSTCDDNDGNGRPDVCEQPTGCGVTPLGTCSNTTCPGINPEECVSRCVRWNPLTGTAVATSCECREVDQCHAVSAISPSPLRGTAGNPCVVADNGSGTVTLPPAGCEYLSPDDVHMIIDGLPAGTTIELTGIHKDFVCNRQPGAPTVCSHPLDVDCDQPGGSLGGDQECADSVIDLALQGTGGLNGFNRNIVLPLSFETHVAPRTPGDPVQSFDTDMFRLFGQITGDPDFDLLRITGGTDFGLPSPGHTTLTQLPGGQWAVDSFFDITYRIDFVGAPGGPLAGMSGSTVGTIRMAAGGGTPTCQGVCPPNTTCVETRTVYANGEVELCCDCQPITPDECAPTPDGSACNDSNCEGDGQTCLPKCAEVDPFTGAVRIVACDCVTEDECHLVGTTPSPGIDGLRGAAGNPCVVTDNGSGTVTLPPAGCEYLSPDEVHMIVDGLPAGTTIELAPIHKDFICHEGGTQTVCSFAAPPGFCEQPGGTMAGHQDCANSQVEFAMNGTGALAGFNRAASIPLSFEVHTAPRTPGDAVQSFDTQMFRMFGQITGDPDFDLLRVVGGTDFGLPSPGHTTLTRLPGGDFAVDSFFDITYRIDFVGAPGGPLAGMSGSTTATIRMQTGGVPGVCQGACPVGTTCNETRTVDPATGRISVCCDCIPDVVDCGPTPNGDGCNDVTCPNSTEACTPKCVNFNPATGQTTVISCECQGDEDCRVRIAPVVDPTRGVGNPPCEVPDDGSGTVTLPPPGCSYLSPQDVHMIIDGLPSGTTITLGAEHHRFFCSGGGNPDGGGNSVCPVSIPPGQCEQTGGPFSGQIDCFESEVTFDLQGTGALSGFSRTIPLQADCTAATGPRTPGDAVQSFPNAMGGLFGEIVGDPDFDLLRITAGDNFGLPSPGHTTLTRLGPPGSNFHVDSFFDITYRIDYIGAPGGPLDGRSGSTTGTIRMEAFGPTPPPTCEGVCPTGTDCNRIVTTLADGTLDICCECIPVQVGACCVSDAANTCGCLDGTDAATCAAIGGQYLGDGTTCAVDGEQCFTGACCQADGTCSDVEPSQCVGFVCDVANYCGGVLCYADADCNGVVNAGDRGIISANFGQTDPDLLCRYDLDGNGVVNPADRGVVSANLGQCVPPPDFQNGSGCNNGACPDPRFPAPPTFHGCGSRCATTSCP